MKAIIVEDEFPAREELKYFINNFSNIDIVSEFDNGVDVLKFMQKNNIDVIFLDINIPMFDGMLLAKTINQFKNKPKIVFITAYKEHAVDAFELDAFDYILKPYSEERIVSTLNKLCQVEFLKLESENRQVNLSNITLWKENKLVVINTDDIYYCEARERETLVYTKENEYISKKSILEFEKKLPSDKFFKVHRSYIVNITKIKEIIPWFNSTYKLKLNDIDNEVYVSRSKIKEFRKVMNI
ncbi:LytTR family DNA-binding domain-containing protein [Clostridium sp. CCUG 7971]|uniref:LytR/AlgR family response regulator transcription factor n=1 Tax=Clostridium sp. CCUG 7971 TaxID=2811414 RepID=UPI001ABAD8A6|nr:LytTR family DNA-binding domain-containing protein [Clostridium sp. CCUG 7971]MBO3443301.1 response regulator transcription factor [Clostridium sp. CCUG 7971]